MLLNAIIIVCSNLFALGKEIYLKNAMKYLLNCKQTRFQSCIWWQPNIFSRISMFFKSLACANWISFVQWFDLKTAPTHFRLFLYQSISFSIHSRLRSTFIIETLTSSCIKVDLYSTRSDCVICAVKFAQLSELVLFTRNFLKYSS